jgi:TolB protein
MNKPFAFQKTWLFFFCVFFLFVSLSPNVFSETFHEKKITGFGWQGTPAVSGSYVVWTDMRNNNYDIFMFDLIEGEERQITLDMSAQLKADISGNFIVWEDYRNLDSEIYLYDINSRVEKRITFNRNEQLNPALDGNYVVWEDYRNGNSDIYLYDIDKDLEKQITDDPASQIYPAISGRYIVWLDYRNDNSEIYLYDMDKEVEIRITDDQAYQGPPSISEDKIVYSDYRHRSGNNEDNSEIYLYDIAKRREKRITNDFNWKQINPRIQGKFIIWEEYRADSQGNIYLYNLMSGKSEKITNNFNMNVEPAIGKKIIAWQEISGQENENDIFVAEIPEVPASGVVQFCEEINNLVKKDSIDQKVRESLVWILDGLRSADERQDYKSAAEGINSLLLFVIAQKAKNSISGNDAEEIIHKAEAMVGQLREKQKVAK